MLQNIRDRAQGWLAWVIVGLLIIPFALWGIQEYLGPSGKVVVAEVEHSEISRYQFENAVKRQMQIFQQNFGQDLSSLKGTIEKSVLNQIIEEEILWQQANKQGLRIGNQWLAAQIQAIPSFQENKQFSQAKYEQVLSLQGLNPPMFEQDYRRSLTADQWRKTLLATSLWSDADAKHYQAIEQQTRQISYVKFDSESFKDKLEITDADLQSYYDERKDNYVTEEQVSIDYVTLATDALKDNIATNEEGLQNYYDERMNRFTTPARWKARHILVPLSKESDAEVEKTALAQVNELLEKVKADGYDSVEAQWKTADNEAGEVDSGEWLTEETARPEMFVAIKDLKTGDTTPEAVRTEFGFHILHVSAAEAERLQPLAEVREELSQEYQQEEARKLFYERAEEFSNLAYENPDNLTVLAETLELELKSTDLFARSGADSNEILKNPKVLTAAFSEQVLKNQNSEVIELGEQHYLLLRLKEHKKSEQQTLETVKEQVREDVVAKKSKEAAEQAGKDLLASLEQGQTPAADWSAAQWVKRQANADLALPSLASTAFKMGKPKDDKALYQSLFVGNDYVVLALSAAKDGEVSDGTLAANAQMELWADSEFSALLASMRADTEVNIYAEKFK